MTNDSSYLYHLHKACYTCMFTIVARMSKLLLWTNDSLFINRGRKSKIFQFRSLETYRRLFATYCDSESHDTASAQTILFWNVSTSLCLYRHVGPVSFGVKTFPCSDIVAVLHAISNYVYSPGLYPNTRSHGSHTFLLNNI